MSMYEEMKEGFRKGMIVCGITAREKKEEVVVEETSSDWDIPKDAVDEQ